MKPAAVTPLPSKPLERPADEVARARGIQRATLVAVATNALLTLGQVVIGLFAGAFSLVADAAHTLSDLVTDLLVLFAGRRGADPADTNHPYGHGRVETATTLLLGLVLAGVGVGFLWSSGVRLQDASQLPTLHPAALVMALLTLAAKEALFRYTLAASRRLKAPMLEANAWHARSDAASSLVVAAGIGGSLAGYPFLEPLAAAVVGFLILHMGVRLVRNSVRELIDTGLPSEQLAEIRRIILETPGVIGLHELRTRRMADRVLCDAHIQVAPKITVSEGHRVSDTVLLRVRDAFPEVRDVLVHIDPEDDGELQVVPPGPIPERTEVVATVTDLLDGCGTQASRVQIHYLGHRVDVDVILAAEPAAQALARLRRNTDAWLKTHPRYRSIEYFVRLAP
jgi:cation diffusion facilitator family transporter